MQQMHLVAAVILGILIPQISSVSFSSPASDRLAVIDTCMSDLCKCERAFYNCEGENHQTSYSWRHLLYKQQCASLWKILFVCLPICDIQDEGCQIKGSDVCNVTIQIALDQFPSLRGCVCAWEEELCDSVQVLASQCPRKPEIQQKKSTAMDWKLSSLINIAYRSSESCMHRIGICVSDSVCNRHLAPVLQACTAEQCESDLCEKETQQFYRNMPQNAAEMLVMCECEASDQSCLQMKAGLQTVRCGDETRICQERLDQCVEDSNCRDLLRTLQAKCWSSDEAQCSDKNLQRDGCFTLRDPALILGTRSECKRAFLATLGTVLHHPCTCKGVHSDHLPRCRMIQDVFHNRSHFITFRECSGGTSKPHEINGSDHAHTWSHDHLLYAFAALLFAGVIIIISLAVVSKIWLLRNRDKNNLCHPRRRNCVVVL